MRLIAAASAAFLGSAMFASCNGGTKSPGGTTPGPGGTTAVAAASVAPTPLPPYTEQGDFAEIAAHGHVRFLMQRHGDGSGSLARDGFPLDLEMEAAEAFAKSVNLEPEWIYVDGYDELIPALLAGQGDIIAANMTVTDTRKKLVAFSVPIGTSRQIVVQRASDPKRITSTRKLAGRKVAVRKSTAYYETVAALAAKNPKIEMEIVPERLDVESVLHGVADGTYDVTVADTNLVDAVLAYEGEALSRGVELTGDRSKAWAVRPAAKELRRALDHFLGEEQLARRSEAVYKDDLPGIRNRKVIRLITRNSAASYFLFRGEVLGFEYELISAFAKKNGLRLEIVVPPARDDLLPYLRDGKGDIVAAMLTASEERSEKERVAFTRPYNYASKIVVTRTKDVIKEPKDLSGRTVVVRKSSSYWPVIEKMQQDGIAVKLMAAPEELETEEIIARVGKGEYDVTVADSPILDIELTWNNEVTAAFPLGDPAPYGWAVREEDKQLKVALDAFLKEEYRGAMYNVAYKKYFKDPRVICKHVEERSDKAGTISPYDELVRKYAREYGFDWRLIAAQMYQESRFDPEARSWVGAVGLMQVMPRTGKQFGFPDVRSPDNGIHAGVKYLSWVREQFDSELTIEDRTWFALASYNAGEGHVIDARRLAREQKLDADRWFGNVEKTMLQLSKPEVARKARFGYCRGEEPVHYVQQIRDRFETYSKVVTAEAEAIPTPATATR